MKHALSDLPALLRTPLGREEIGRGLRYRMFPWAAAQAKRRRHTALADVCLVAVVGSLGKTTARRFTQSALGQTRIGVGNRNAFWGLARTVLNADPTLSELVIEAGINRPGEMTRYAKILSPDITVVTAIASEHREFLGDPQTTRHEKAFMVRALPTDGIAVLNGDDENVLWMATQTEARVITFGLGSRNDVRATEIETDWPHGTRFRLHIGDDSWPARVRLFGRPMVYSALAGIAVAHAVGRDVGDILSAIGNLPPTPQRLCPVPLKNLAWLLDDTYKSPAETMVAALETLEECQANRKFVVMGPVPDYTEDPETWYSLLASALARVADRALLIGGGYEPFVEAASRQGLAHSGFIDGGHDILGAAGWLRERLAPDDLALVKGYRLHTDRIVMQLTGSSVGCELSYCPRVSPCRTCPMCERGWRGRRPVM